MEEFKERDRVVDAAIRRISSRLASRPRSRRRP